MRKDISQFLQDRFILLEYIAFVNKNGDRRSNCALDCLKILLVQRIWYERICVAGRHGLTIYRRKQYRTREVVIYDLMGVGHAYIRSVGLTRCSVEFTKSTCLHEYTVEKLLEEHQL